ncbi:unnamed protein product [Penicillium salamii]|uniref:FAD dependent oxidoreductase domain-containing protein n=1 Tax=Penicillium salamii TaxID=1612424 RepID=A0A9W4P1Q1_9EURO|nr:unnamed protein product [Penicillium salamii]CAG8159727.1 unnamed protein product [Penicillium salamii]CAG8191943.1 unnamed protein product [Penicillium salamii]CAG8310457.1 unnamed protein product [Penicillium salamii]CAG8355238.1 unnamed protein product [Penicillium salamii]
MALSTALAFSARHPAAQVLVISDQKAPDDIETASAVDFRRLQGDCQSPAAPSLYTEARDIICHDRELRHCLFTRGEVFALVKGDAKSTKILEEKKAILGLDDNKSASKLLPSPESIRSILSISSAADSERSGHATSRWQEAIFDKNAAIIDLNQLLLILFRRCQARSNIAFKFGVDIERPIISDNAFKGVVLKEDSDITAQTTVLADAQICQKLMGLSPWAKITGHDSTWLKPAESVWKKYKDIPVLTNLSTCFTVFPSVNGEFKCTLKLNDYGDTNALGIDSCPWSLTPSTEREIRRNLAEILPEAADQPISRSRLEWVMTTESHSDFIARNPQFDRLLIATLPTSIEPQAICLGAKAVDLIDQIATSRLSQKWSLSDTNTNSKNTPGFHKPIVIVGAGVFGLTTALHLARRGYKNVTILDREAYDHTGYTSSAASADRNKIIRASYGKQKLYESLAFKSLDSWEEWNSDVRNASDLPDSLHFSDRLWDNCGFVRAGELSGLDPQETATQDGFPEALKDTQYRLSDESRKKDARMNDINPTKLDPFNRLQRGLGWDGILDGTGGYVAADKSCSWVLYLCQKLGVQTKLGDQYTFKEFIRDGDKIIGVKTGLDGTSFPADLVIVAAGGWTPSVVPEVADLLQTTAGSVAKIQLPPQNERHDLWRKYSSSEFPCWSWRLTGSTMQGTEVGGIYGFPRTQDGLIKIGFRGTKWTNMAYSNAEGRLISYPTSAQGLPNKALDNIREFCRENMPDLVGLPLSTRLCWYTDSVDSNFLVDRVPGTKGLIVASGGSGHAFKFLPVLGEHVVDVVERKETDYTNLFKWRDPSVAGQKARFNTPSGNWPELEKDDLSGAW